MASTHSKGDAARTKNEEAGMREKMRASMRASMVVEEADNPLHGHLHAQSGTGSDPGNAETGAGMVEMVDFHGTDGLSDAPGLRTEDQGSTVVDVNVEERTDPATGNTYYYSHTTGETSWDRPEVAAPPDMHGEIFVHTPKRNPNEVTGGLTGVVQTDVV